MANGLHEMSFADANSSPNKKGIIRKAGIFNDTLGSGVGEIITVANDEGVEGIF